MQILIQMAIVEVPITWRLTRLLKKEDISLIVLNCDVHYHLAGAFSSKIAGIPCICRKAGGIGEGKKIKKVLTPFVDLFIAVSKATARDQIRNNPRTRRLVITYEGVDSKMFNNKMDPCEKKKELGISTDKKIICSISRFDGGKGQLELLEAASLIIKKYQDVIFLLVGDGELMDDLRRKTQRLNLNHYVVFTGWRKDVPEVLSIIDIFVHCPTTCIEALGIANLEAMAMGKPCVVSDNGGLPDAVLDGVTGFVVPVGNIERMAEAILTLLQNEELMKNFGENARKRVEEEFDIRKNIKKLEMYFEEYCDRRKPRGQVLKCQ
jgi:glycosyltransferase involved in cell wall biosynthesis